MANTFQPAKGAGTQITVHAADFRKYDLNKIDDRAKAVRDILSACGYNEETDDKWPQHLIDGYSMLLNTGLADRVVRKMTDEELEMFHTSTYKAVTAAPALTDYVSLLHPTLSAINPTLATDQFFRITIGWWFFDPSIRPAERGTMLVHEVMHGVYGHYELPRLEPEKVNIAGDAVINQGIEHSKSNNMRFPENRDKSDYFVFPRTIKTDSYPNGMSEHEPFMKYYAALEEQEDKDKQNASNGNSSNSNKNNNQGGGQSQSNNSGNSGSNSSNSGSNNGSNSGGNVTMEYEDGSSTTLDGNMGNGPCHDMTPEEAAGLDSNGIEKAGELEKEMARAGAQTKAMEQLQKNRSAEGSAFNQFLLDALLPPKVKWEQYLKTIMSRQFNTIISGHTDYSYRRPSRRSDPNGFIRPSMISYAPSIIIGCDCSGSMGEKDYAEALGEVEGLCKALHCTNLRFITVDTEITSSQVCHHAKDLKLVGGGGTVMTPLQTYCNNLPQREKPDLIILATDGYLDYSGWEEYVNAMDKTRQNIVLITDEGGMEQAKPFMNTKNLTVLPIY